MLPGIFLATHYTPHINLAFSSVEHTMRDVNHGSMICYIDADATLNRFFGIHFILPFIIADLTIIHLVLLHRDGSNNPLGVGKVPFYPYFFVKDLHAFFVFLLVFAVLVLFLPKRVRAF
jgi:quinol-cytochrome oxidoreductase complex cytochrome b subunit